MQVAGAGVVLRVWVSPKRTPERILRLVDGSVRAYVAVPSDGGRANLRLVQLLARLLRLPPEDIQIISGTTNPRKLVRIAHQTHSEIRRRIPRVPPGHYTGKRRIRRRGRTRLSPVSRRAAR